MGQFPSATQIRLTQFRQPSRLGFRAFLLLAFLLGGAAFALASGGLAPSLAYGRLDQTLAGHGVSKLALLTGAGLLMGFGARAAGGCTSGHGMSGTSLGSPTSLVATGTFFATAVATAHLLSLFGGLS